MAFLVQESRNDSLLLSALLGIYLKPGGWLYITFPEHHDRNQGFPFSLSCKTFLVAFLSSFPMEPSVN